jgi:phosphatidylethanolamine-binding protein (PEBP) family uncharacterized protein
MNAKKIMRLLAILATVALAATLAVAQAPAGAQGPPPGAGGQGAGAGAGGGGGRGGPGGGGGGGGRGGPRGPAFTVTTSAWPDGDVIPAKYVNAGDKKSPAFDFKWMMGPADAMQPATVQSFAIVFHDIENVPNATGEDTLHWMIWDIPGTAKGITEGLPMGDLPDGSKQCACNIGRGAYFGPGAGPGAYHHYVFEFYALDIKLGLPATATRAAAMAAMYGHIVGKAAYVGRYHQ